MSSPSLITARSRYVCPSSSAKYTTVSPLPIASFSWEVVEPNHAPAIGFVPRKGFQNYNPRISWNQNLQRHPWLRSFGTSWDANLIVDMNNRWLTREINWSIFRFQTNSQEGMFFQLSPEYQRLEEDFEISSGIVLPSGSDYSFCQRYCGSAWSILFFGVMSFVNAYVVLIEHLHHGRKLLIELEENVYPHTEIRSVKKCSVMR